MKTTTLNLLRIGVVVIFVAVFLFPVIVYFKCFRQPLDKLFALNHVSLLDASLILYESDSHRTGRTPVFPKSLDELIPSYVSERIFNNWTKGLIIHYYPPAPNAPRTDVLFTATRTGFFVKHDVYAVLINANTYANGRLIDIYSHNGNRPGDNINVPTKKSTAKPDNKTPDEILDTTEAAYASLKSYSDEGITKVTLDNSSNTITFKVKLARPYLYRIEWLSSPTFAFPLPKRKMIWSTGDNNFMDLGNGVINEDADFRKAASGLTQEKQKELSRGMTFTLSRVPTMISQIFYSCIPGVYGIDWSKINPTRQADENIDGANCYVISFVPSKNHETMTFWIGTNDHLIRMIQTVATAEDQKLFAAEIAKQSHVPVSEGTLDPFEVTEVHRNIQINWPVDQKAFLP